MLAAVLQRPERTERRRVPVPRPGPGQVLVRLEGCGVCGSSLPVWEGRPWFTYPLDPGAPGHEGWGRVQAVGDDVNTIKVGDRVALLSQHAFASWDVINADAVVALPPQLDDHPFPGEALGCAMNVLRRCAVEPGQAVAIIGIGFMGAVLTQLAARAGAEVIAVSRRPFAMEIARQCGAKHVWGMDRAQEQISRAFPDGCDLVIEAAGHQTTLDLAGRIIAVRGRLVIAGYHQDGPVQVDMQNWNWKGIDVVNAHERSLDTQLRGMREAVLAVTSGALDPSPLYTHTFSLDELDEAFSHVQHRPNGFLKALVITP